MRNLLAMVNMEYLKRNLLIESLSSKLRRFDGKNKFKRNIQKCWLSEIVFNCFPSSYFVKRDFNAVTTIPEAKQNHLDLSLAYKLLTKSIKKSSITLF